MRPRGGRRRPVRTVAVPAVEAVAPEPVAPAVFGLPGPARAAAVVAALAIAFGAHAIGPPALRAETAAPRFGPPPADLPAQLDRLVAAYPAHLSGWSFAGVRWRDGALSPLSDGRAEKSFAEWLARPDLDDMFAVPYPAGAPLTPPRPLHDPGRARPQAFFVKMYGDCRKGEVAPRLRSVRWLANTAPQTLRVTTVNAVADRLERISAEIEQLPAPLRAAATPAAGTFNCRTIAGTDRLSAHAYAAAIDLNVGYADYWRWTRRTRASRRGAAPFRNRMPAEIVAIFERHGFIWGGRWSHYDTMHFEYRPELAPPRPNASIGRPCSSRPRRRRGGRARALGRAPRRPGREPATGAGRRRRAATRR